MNTLFPPFFLRNDHLQIRAFVGGEVAFFEIVHLRMIPLLRGKIIPEFAVREDEPVAGENFITKHAEIA